jgi:hypothetical protein
VQQVAELADAVGEARAGARVVGVEAAGGDDEQLGIGGGDLVGYMTSKASTSILGRPMVPTFTILILWLEELGHTLLKATYV